MPKKNAATRGIKDFASNIDSPGLIIINTPIKLINIAIQIFNETFSLKIMADKATTIIGVKDAILCASAKVRYRNDKTKHPDSSNDNTLLKNCNFKLFEM